VGSLDLSVGTHGQGGVLNHQVPLVTEAGLAPTAAAMAMGITAGMGGFGNWVSDVYRKACPFIMWPWLLRHSSPGYFPAAGLPIFDHGLDLCYFVWFRNGGIVVLLPLAVSHFFGLAAFGTIMGTVAFIQGIGSSSGALISGLIFDHMGNYRYA